MSASVLANEPLIRLGIFAGILIAMVLWEALMPRRRQEVGRLRRWPSNLGIVAVDTLLVRLIFPIAAVGIALLAEERGWGLLNILPVPFWLAVIASVILLDLAIYLQHVAFHAVPVLWRLHRMHHADLEFDVTTGVRFHPIEILLSMAIKFVVVVALGAPALAVLIFEVLLNATSMFNHGNVSLPPAIDRVLRWIVVTPDMHRVHHSIIRRETDSNYGFNLPWWDRLFGTYRSQPEAGHDGMTIGIDAFRDPRELRLDRMLIQPFIGDDGRSPPRQPWIDVQQLAARMNGGGAPIIVDVRGHEEFSGPLGHIGGARNVPVNELPHRLHELADFKHQPLVLVCRTDRRSASAAEVLHSAGFRQLQILRGGMEQWNRNGLPVQQ